MTDQIHAAARTGADGPGSGTPELPPHRYTAAMAGEVEARWQEIWSREDVYRAPNPGEPGFDPSRPKLFVLDMFPYPSGAGLHVGHPLGYIATDIYARYNRMDGRNVLHAMGFDAFGLPAEQYAIETGTHPRSTTEKNIETFRRQLARLGLDHEPRRSVATTDPDFVRWTQWIFLQIFGSWYDTDADSGRGRARPISELIQQFEQGKRQTPPEYKPWKKLGAPERDALIDSYRLAYVADVDVNWCPALGTVLANEEVTADGRSERGNHPVVRRPLRQWMMRITAYCERLLDDLELVDWPEPVRMMQRNWIGRSEGAWIDFDAGKRRIRVFTTRPDTVFGATYMVLAPEHPLVDELVADSWGKSTPASWKGRFPGVEQLVNSAAPRALIEAYRAFASGRSDIERQAETRDKTGVFIGAYAINPANDQRIPIFIADYVLMGYGTGAIMAVPGQDQRDWDFAREFDLPIIRTVKPPDGFEGEAYLGEGPAINSGLLDGLGIADAKSRIIEHLEQRKRGRGAVQYKLRDWLFSRQRYWGEPFPIVYEDDDTGSVRPIALPDSMLPVELPEMDDFRPTTSDDPDAPPVPALGRADDWARVTLDLGDGARRYRRELNTMPQWAGSCWYYLRYLDPANEERFVDPEVERYWMAPSRDGPGGVDLYVGGAEHAVLHLLYARFWHKILHDLGHVSTPEPFARLFNQGYIQAPAYVDARDRYVDAERVVESGPGSGSFTCDGEPVRREFGKMGKSLRNVITPDDVCEQYGADTLRLYEMTMGPLDKSKPWNPRDIVGMHSFLQRVWRNIVDEETGALRITDDRPDESTWRLLHRTIAGVRDDLESLGFNTAIAKLIELNNHITKQFAVRGAPRQIAEPLVLMLSPMAPHISQELWSRLGHDGPIVRVPFPEADTGMLSDDSIEIPVQVQGKVRARITVASDAGPAMVEQTALADDRVQRVIDGKQVRKVVVVPGRMVNIVID